MKHFYTTALVSLLITCNQLHASSFKISDVLLYAHAVVVEFEALSEKEIPQKANKLHQDVANLDRFAILGLINYHASKKSCHKFYELIHDKNEHGDTPYDQAKKGAMNLYWPVKIRKEFYEICDIFKELDAPSSINLIPQPSNQIMEFEYTTTINNIVTQRPEKRDHLKKA